MKILHFTHSVTGASGVATFVRELDSALETRGVDSCVLCERAGSPKGVEESSNCDLVHVHGLWRPYFHRVVEWAYAHENPVVWSTHGMTAPWAMHHKRLKKALAWWLYQRGDLKRAALIHCTTELEMEWNRRLGFDNCFIAPLGTNECKRENHKYKKDKCGKVLLFVGRLHPVKGLENLIEAWGRVVQSSECGVRSAGLKVQSSKFEVQSEEFGVQSAECGVRSAGCKVRSAECGVQSWRLRIVGPDEGGYMSRLKALVQSWRLEDSVEFAGPKFGEDLSREYDNCDCLVLPSFTENFGATIIDALAHGKPCIASTFTPWKKLQDCDCGWWVDNEPSILARAIREMIEASDGRRESMGERGRKLVEEEYSWDSVASKMVGAYENLLNR